MNSVIPNKLKEELEDVGKVYDSRSGVRVYPNAFSRLQNEIMKICNENKMLKEGKTNVFAELNEETEKSNEMLMNKVRDLEAENSELKSDNDARKFAMTMSEKVEKQLRAENAELKEKLTAIRNAKDKYDMSKDKSTIKALGAEYTLFCDLERLLEDWQEDDKLTKAIEIIRMVVNSYNHKERFSFEKDLKKAEQFLSEVEK